MEPAGTHALTAQEAEEWNAEVANTIRDLNTQQRLRDFGQKVIDPTNQAGGWFFQKYVLPIADNAGLLATFSIPRAWPLMLGIRAQAHQEEQYQRLVNEGWDELDPATNRTAFLIGLGQSALDEGFGKILEGLPELSGTLKNFALTGGAGSRLLYNTGKTAVGGTIFSLVQGQLVPAALQDVLASNPQFKPDWGRVWSDTAKAIPDTFAGMLLLAAAGATFQVARASAAAGDRGGAFGQPRDDALARLYAGADRANPERGILGGERRAALEVGESGAAAGRSGAGCAG